jgi:predicted phage gp36 major capsid-like protein
MPTSDLDLTHAALDLLHAAQIRIAQLEQQNQALRDELRRVIRAAMGQP